MILKSIAAAIVLLSFAVGPVSAATAPGAQVQVAQTAAVTVSGTVKNTSGAPLAGVAIDLRGPQNYSTTTDSTGGFSIESVVPGVYVLTAQKAGYETTSQSDFAVLGGQAPNVAIVMHTATLSSLQTIATVKSNGGNTFFNTTPASINVVTAQEFVNQAQPQVGRILNQIPGVQNSFPGTSANGAAPGSITVPNIRGAGSYETATLIDGHPLAVGSFGDYVTTFLSSALFGEVEVVKGPGADAPEVNNAIGGTLNFRTKDPTATATPTYLFGADNHGGTFGTLGISDTLGRFGFVLQVAELSEPSAINGTGVYFDPSFGFLPNGNQIGSKNTSGPVGNTQSFNTNSYSLLACCFPVMGDLNQVGELAKLRYHFSGATTATVSYLGGQASSDQVGNTGNYTFAPLVPTNAGPGYTGPVAPGTVLPVDFLFAGQPTRETNNEPIFQAEVQTTLNTDTVLARYYHASISRLQYQGSQPGLLDYVPVTLYGVDNFSGTAFNGTSTQVGFLDYFRETEQDKLAGLSFEYQHPFGDRDDVTFSVDQTNAQSTDYTASPNSFFPGPTVGASYAVSIPTGSSQLFTTYLLRGHLYFGDKFFVTLADYQNTYRNTFATFCPMSGGFNNCNYDGSNVGFSTTNTSHNDPRIGLVYRPKNDLSVRLAAGSAIAPPYLGILSGVPSGGVSAGSGNYGIITQPNVLLKPETSFGYDLGADWRIPNGWGVVSLDGYETNLFNHFFGQTVPTGLTCGAPIICPSPVAPGAPIYSMTTINVSNFRFEGIELSVKRAPDVGWGYSLGGALQRGYVYNLPPGFYCSVPISQAPCTPATYDQNLNIVPNENYNGEGVGFSSTIGSLNTRIPYFQGDANVSYTTKSGIYALFGETLYGKNNSLNEPPFGIAYLTVRAPITPNLSVQISGDNIFNAWSQLIPSYTGGVAIPLANGGTAATTGNVLGPAIYRFMITQRLP